MRRKEKEELERESREKRKSGGLKQMCKLTNEQPTLLHVWRRGEQYFGLLAEKCSTAKSKFWQVEALDLLLEALKPFVSVNKNEGTVVLGKKMISGHLSELCVLIKELVTNMPEKQARRAKVHRFCGRMFHILSTLKLSTKFLKSLDSKVDLVCGKEIGKAFLDLKKKE
ncbi:hypothetical protein Tco_0098175 [Tanacetum coccineum]